MIGRTLAHYEITGHLGTGGMGEVYQATDSRLSRTVAIKFLPEAFAQDGERVARFQREARMLAALNHPNIASIHGLEESNGHHFLVMEMVPGETLADRIQQGRLPLDEALGIAKQISEALDTAHERGIVHRDLKPANIKITPEGTVKVLDFGLAKAYDAETSNVSLANSPTISRAATQAGVILGTAAYMSPEQARGKAVDRRADIWAFGVVLYEMVTGRRLFDGETVSDTLAAVLERDVRLDAVPEKVRMLLKGCLERDPRRRLRDIGDVWRLLELPSSKPVESSPARKFVWLLPAALGLLLAAALVPASLYFVSRPEEFPEMRFEWPAPGSENAFISPDGLHIAYAAPLDGKSVVWTRPIGSLTAKPISGTESVEGGSLFWSPDSRNLAFVAEGKLKKVDVTTGAFQTLYDGVVIPASGAMNEAGDVLVSSFGRDGPILLLVPSSGGMPGPVIPPLKPEEGIALLPQFLPDGRSFLYHTVPTPGATGTVWAASLDSKTPTRLMEIPNFAPFGNSYVRYVPQGYLLFARDRTLFAHQFDVESLTVSGNPVPLTQNVIQFSASNNGTIVYRPPGEATTESGQNLFWLDRQGNPVGRVPIPSLAGSVELSRDNSQRIAIDTNLQSQSDVWVIDPRGVPQAIANLPVLEAFPVWSPDGANIAYNALTEGRNRSLYQRAANAVGASATLLSTQDVAIPGDWSSDGKTLVFELFKIGNQNSADIWTLTLSGERKSAVYLETPAREAQPQLSPDEKYLAYTTNINGRYQIVVRTFPDPNKNSWTITSAGGIEPRWRRKDGGELYYLSLDGKMMAVKMTYGATLDPGSAEELFTAPTLVAQPNPFFRRYDVTADGQRFLFATLRAPSPATTPSQPIVAIINWTRALKKN